VVVNFAVEDEPGALVAAVHRLMTGGGKVDDRQATETETAAMLVEDQLARVVRTAMRHFIAHARDQRKINASFARAVFPNSANAAHQLVKTLGKIFQLSLPGSPEIRQHAETESISSP
jgi:hypothetical protein